MRNRESGTIFRQSLTDFPCPVVLGQKSPSFGLHRYKQGLQFVPLDDEGFSLRGDKRRLLYQGRRRSHRFTILGNTSFEYDCILEKEPESNVVSLMIVGGEHFDFYQQPYYIKDPYLKGSYAVYKKNTLIGEGTGKLCHIHRPLIIDARGRRVWGTLAVIGNELKITIPEKWLSEAKYPVIVDPVVGTTTVGSQYQYYDTSTRRNEHIVFSEMAVVNKYTLPDNMFGNAIGYIYAFRTDMYQGKWYSNSNWVEPCIFSDVNNKPYERLSANEQQLRRVIYQIDNDGWFPATFSTNRIINGGSNIWVGVSFCDYQPRFDFGARCYIGYLDFYEDENYGVPDMFPYPEAELFDDYGINTKNIIISFYFSYTAMQNYVRTITQGVSLFDNRRIIGNYKRTVTQIATISSLLNRVMSIYHKCISTVNNIVEMKKAAFILRAFIDHITITTRKKEIISFIRECFETVKINTFTNKLRCIIRNLHEDISLIDQLASSMFFLRIKKETAHVKDKAGQWKVFIREIFDTVENAGEISHIAAYNRLQRSTTRAQGSVLRSIFFVVRIMTRLFIRDYLLNRFLKSKTELTLKSKIIREIIIESRLND